MKKEGIFLVLKDLYDLRDSLTEEHERHEAYADQPTYSEYDTYARDTCKIITKLEEAI